MIVDLPATTVSKISKRLVQLREQGGAVALGRVLNLVIETDFAGIESSVKAANEASREHPCRIIVLAGELSGGREQSRLDAQIRVGGDAGASEVVVLKAFGETFADIEGLVVGLLLPDAPVVAWWPAAAPVKVAESALGKIAQRRITDAAAQPDPQAFLRQLASGYTPGDSDFAWTRLTIWRTQLASILDQPPYEPILEASVSGVANSPSLDLLAAWLRQSLDVPVTIERLAPEGGVAGIQSVRLVRSSGASELIRKIPGVTSLIIPGQAVRELSMPLRSLRDCLSEDLRRLDPDDMFGAVITKGFSG